MDIDDSSDLTSSIKTSLLDTPTEFERPSLFNSLRNEPSRQPATQSLEGYQEVDWQRVKGFSVPMDDFKKKAGIYNLSMGWRLVHRNTQQYYWLCRRCHVAKRTLAGLRPPLFKCTDATTAANKHLNKVHNLDTSGNCIRKKRPHETSARNGDTPAAAASNELAVAFDHNTFKAKLYAWLIADNVAFNQLESEEFNQLLIYLNPRCQRWIPARNTASRTIASIHDRSIGVVQNNLATAVTRINLSFDLWTSGNKLALLGLCAHFINQAGQPVTSLLSLPKQTGRHTGVRIADSVSDIITAYGLNDKIGYFTTDNASSNASCMDALAKEWCFSRDERWIRCCGHIFNLVGQAALFGNDHQVFSNDVTAIELEEQQLTLWRRRGPIGKLHNVIHWINRSPQRHGRFISLQKQLIAPIRPDGKKEAYQLITDVTTRWNSFYDSAKRAVYLQAAIDAIIDEERAAYDSLVAQAGRSLVRQQPKRPTILDDTISAADWHVINQYIDILKPLKDATLKLQGHIGGKFGSIWQVLPVFEELLHHFENRVEQYPVKEQLTPFNIHSQPPSGFSQQPDEATASQLTSLTDDQATAEDHFSINIKLAWAKLNEYYAKLDNSPVYVAAVVLHPCHKWRWLEARWKERPDWISAARQSFNQLADQYRQYEPPEALQSPAKRPRLDIDVTEDYPSDEDDDERPDIDQQLVSFKTDSTYRHLLMKKETSPIAYWLAKRAQWPQLAALALDIYSIAVMSDEPERVFSTTGAAVTPRRRSLLDETINHLMVVKAWLKAKLITLDRYGYIHFTGLGLR